MKTEPESKTSDEAHSIRSEMVGTVARALLALVPLLAAIVCFVLFGLPHIPGFRINNDIVFYGVVVDEEGKPLSHAEVTGIVTLTSGVFNDKQTSTSHFVRTDKEGKFTLSGLYGDRLRVLIEKDGYDGAPAATLVSYSEMDSNRHVPDASKPVVIRLKKAPEPPPLSLPDEVQNPQEFESM